MQQKSIRDPKLTVKERVRSTGQLQTRTQEQNLDKLTVVMVSIQRTRVSDVRYRESDSAYSFHN